MDSENVLDLLFTVISVFYAFRGLQIAATVVQNWAALKGPNFTPQTKSLASQASFFLAVPIGVFFHELAHATFVRLFGGQVVEFGYRVFWGFVEHSGNYSAEQAWFIALAGTLASLLFGLFCWLALKDNPSPTFRYFGLRAFRFQIFFSLIYYPVFTLMGFYGDWRMIYDFNATPIASGATAAAHAVLLLLFWQADRSGFFEMGAFGSPETKARITALEERAAAAPFDTNLQLQLIKAYQKGGMANKAKQQVQKFLKENPNSAEGHLQLALIEGMGRREVPSKAKNEAVKALSLGLGDPEATASAHLLVGRYNFGVNKVAEAVDQFSQGIEAVKTADSQEILISLLYYRTLAYRRKQQYDAAYRDVQRAIQLARSSNNQQLLSLLNRELQTISQHSGRSPDQFTTPPNQ